MGAPNVGKSSLVQVLSSGEPEVCDYPFTTRSIKMGHFYVDEQRHQVHIPSPFNRCWMCGDLPMRTRLHTKRRLTRRLLSGP